MTQSATAEEQPATTSEVSTPELSVPPAAEDEARWYAVHVFSNYEKRVADELQAAVDAGEAGGSILEVLLPTETVIEVRRGQRREVERRFMPGYVLVRMVMNKQSYHYVNELQRVIGFLEMSEKPEALADEEIRRVKSQVVEGIERPRPSVTYVVGEEVRVLDGPFESFSGQVEEVNESEGRVKVNVMIFGRPTPVEFDFGQVQKIS